MADEKSVLGTQASDEFAINDDGFCIQNGELCINIC